MAEALPDNTDSIRCSECNCKFDMSDFDVGDYDGQVQDYLHTNNDLYGMFEHRFELAPIIEEVPITIQCLECDSDIEIRVEVKAEPVWCEDDLENDRDPHVDHFDITWNGGISFEDQLNESLKIFGFERHVSIREVNIRIICKTVMNNGYCYIGYDEGNKRLLRPIFRTQTGQCCWPNARNFEIFNSYAFNVLHHPDIPAVGYPPTPLPHQRDDLLVIEEMRPLSSMHPFSPSLLEDIAQTQICDLFPVDLIKDNKFIYEGADCPSVGLLLTSEKNVRLNVNIFDKKRLYVPGGYDFPVTGLQFDQPKGDGNRRALVLLGLGRPWPGKNNEYHPARCYILVLNLFLY